jgi:hypothetical protein
MFRKKQIEQACDNLCRAEALRDATLVQVALLRPRI